MQKRAFTLIELLVVIAIIAILAAIVLVTIGNINEDARDARVKAEMNELRTEQHLYKEDNNTYAAYGDSTDVDRLVDSVVSQAAAAATGDLEVNGATAWCMDVTLYDGTYYCVDSTLYGGAIANLTTCSDTGFSCE